MLKYFQHPELLKWFKDFVGFRDGAGPVGSGSEQAISSSESQRLRPERLIGDSSMEIGRYRQSDTSDLRQHSVCYCISVESEQ